MTLILQIACGILLAPLMGWALRVVAAFALAVLEQATMIATAIPGVICQGVVALFRTVFAIPGTVRRGVVTVCRRWREILAITVDLVLLVALFGPAYAILIVMVGIVCWQARPGAVELFKALRDAM
jgi:hypothetical protein